MARNLRPKSNLCFLKPTQLKQPKRAEKIEIPGNVDIPLMNSQIVGLNNVIKELEGKLKKCEEKNESKERDIQALEDEFLTVLTEMIKTKKENDFLKAQLKMQQCANECELFPLLVNEKLPADISMFANSKSGHHLKEATATKVDACVDTGNFTVNTSFGTEANRKFPSLDQVFDLSDQREPHERGPVSEEAFDGWDKLLNRNAVASMKLSYLSINLKDMKEFIKECIIKTFETNFILKISFESGSSFNQSNVLSCLIETVQEKFKEKNLDDKETRKKIIAAFRRFRDAKAKSNKNTI